MFGIFYVKIVTIVVFAEVVNSGTTCMDQRHLTTQLPDKMGERL
jgi:hypothetical protein